jgi:glycosyltransferase involved in cell wall biosynthesis
MDVYADNLVAGIRYIRPEWEVREIAPVPWSNDPENSWHSGNPFRKYYERFWNHPRAVSQLNVDVFHIIDHSNAHVAYWLKTLGKPIVVTCHDLVQYIYPEILRDRSRFPALSMAMWRYSADGMRSANHIVAVSENTAKDINQMLNVGSERVTVVPNGVESQFRVLPGEETETWRRQYQTSSEEICLLNVGSTHQRKNIPTILKVLEVLKDKGLSVRLWKIGSDFTTEQKQFISDRDLGDRITLLGQPDKETLIKFYNAADALIAPSLYEGFGLTILEAMACGAPVITSNVSSLPEVTGDAAISVAPTDVSAIADSVCRIANDPAYRQQLVEKGLVRAKMFSWKNSAEQIAQIYEKLAIAPKSQELAYQP